MKSNNSYGDTHANAGIQIVTYDIKNKLIPMGLQITIKSAFSR